MANFHSSQGIQTLAGQDGKIRCAHLLVKHKDSRRPASWREAKITRSMEEAREAIDAYNKEIKAYSNGETTYAPTGRPPRSLSELATTESDCSSARKGGDL